LTASTINGGYLNFMGNEFGHPEWIDFPREGNNWSCKYARRQWSLADNPLLRYQGLQERDAAMVHLLRGEKALFKAPELLRADEEKKVLIFLRKNCIFALNFNPSESYQNYGFPAPEGEWEMVMNSDEARFGGFSRLGASEIHATVGKELFLYLPSRCAIVLKKK
jgi:1,4-alpha-glucan branching enzyme